MIQLEGNIPILDVSFDFVYLYALSWSLHMCMVNTYILLHRMPSLFDVGFLYVGITAGLSCLFSYSAYTAWVNQYGSYCSVFLVRRVVPCANSNLLRGENGGVVS